MITCQKCGSSVSLSDAYCRNCGNPQDQQRNRMIFERETDRRMKPCVEKFIFKYRKENYFFLLWESGKQPSLNYRHLSNYGHKLLLLELELDRFKTELRYSSQSSIDRKKHSIEIREEKIEKLITTLQDIVGDRPSKPAIADPVHRVPSKVSYEGHECDTQIEEDVSKKFAKSPALFVCACSAFATLIIWCSFSLAPFHEIVSVFENDRGEYVENDLFLTDITYQEEVLLTLCPSATKQKPLSLTSEIERELRNKLPSKWKVVTVEDIGGIRIHICVQDSENDQFSPIWEKETPHSTVSKTCANVAFLCIDQSGGGYWVSVAVKDSTGMAWESYRWRENNYKNGSVITDGWLTDFH